MRNIVNLSFGIVVLALLSCGGSNNSGKQQQEPQQLVKQLNVNSPDCDQYVLMSTNYGDIKIKLYRETPLHRKNFINLVMNGFYDGQLFYRVQKDLLIQTGDYTSKTKPDGPELGVTDVEFTVPAEIDPVKRIHKRGALAAASFYRGEKSSGAHFYIVTGKPAKDNELKLSERKINEELVNNKFLEIQKPYRQQIYRLKNAAEHDVAKKEELGRLIGRLMSEARAAMKGKEFSYTAAQRNLYKKTGGLPHLDAYYTVFGEVVEGLEVIEAMQETKTDRFDRPYEDIKIVKATLVE